MPSFHAKAPCKQRTVVFVIFPGVTLLDVSGPLQVFNHRKSELGANAPYKVVFVSREGGAIETDASIFIETEPAQAWVGKPIQTLMTVGSATVRDTIKDTDLIEVVASLVKSSKRVCSVCSGAFVLAATGILNGRNAVTHWEDCPTLANDFPEIKIDSDSIFLKDGDVWTSAGCSAGIDLALALVSEDLGHAYALEVARSIVAYMVRPGGQLQFSGALQRQIDASSNRFDKLDAWIRENLHLDLHVDQLAQKMNMSTRNFSRCYTRSTGYSPAKAVVAFRIEVARELLQSSNLPISTIAERCGFEDDERMRRAFVRAVNVSPTDYRKRFQGTTKKTVH